MAQRKARGALARYFLGNQKHSPRASSEKALRILSELTFEPLEPRILLSADPLLLSSTSSLALIAGLQHDTGVSAADRVTNDPTVTGKTSIAGNIARLDGAIDASARADLKQLLQDDGSFTLSPVALQNVAGGALEDGAHTLHLSATDTAGKTKSRDLTFVLDTTAPTIHAADIGTSNANRFATTPVIAGTVTDLNRVASFKGGLDATAPEDFKTLWAMLKADGTFGLNLARLRLIAGGSLADGPHTLHLIATDRAGNSSSFDLAFVLDTADPALAFNLANDSGAKSNDRLTSDPTVVGHVTDANSIDRLGGTIDGGDAADLTATIQPNGSFTLTPELMRSLAGGQLQDGAHTLRLNAVDTSGRTTARELTFVLDTNGPSITAAASAGGRSPTAPVISGKMVDLNGIASISGGLDDAAAADFKSLRSRVKPDGTFDLTLGWLRFLAGGSLADGAHTLHISATDKAGNTSGFDVSFAVGAAPLSLTGKLLNDTGSSNADGVTHDPTVVGRAKGTTPVTALQGVLDGGAHIDLTALLQADGSFTLLPSVLESLAGGQLTDGSHALQLSATNAGNATASLNLTFTLDTLAPQEPRFDLAAGSDTGVAGDHTTSAATVTLQGVTDPHGVVMLSALGLTTTADDGGAFAFTGVLLAAGKNTFAAQATDLAGNQSLYALDIHLDSTKPSLSASLASDTGADAADGITTTASIAGAVQDDAAGDLADLRAGLDGTPSANFISVTSAVQNDGSFLLDAAIMNQLAGGTLADGAHTLHLVATDIAGNATPLGVAFTLDTVAPPTPVFDLAPSSDTGTPGDQITEAGLVTLAGMTEANAVVTLLEIGRATTADNTGAFRFDDVALALGTTASPLEPSTSPVISRVLLSSSSACRLRQAIARRHR